VVREKTVSKGRKKGTDTHQQCRTWLKNIGNSRGKKPARCTGGVAKKEE